MRANHHVDFARGQAGNHALGFGRAHETRKHFYFYWVGLEAFTKRGHVLRCQQRGWHEHRSLFAIMVFDDDALATLREEWADRFGPLPSQATALLRIGSLRVACHRAALSRVVVQDASVRLFPVRLNREGELRVDSVTPKNTYDRDALTLRIDVPKGEGAVEFLLRALPRIFASDSPPSSDN